MVDVDKQPRIGLEWVNRLYDVGIGTSHVTRMIFHLYVCPALCMHTDTFYLGSHDGYYSKVMRIGMMGM